MAEKWYMVEGTKRWWHFDVKILWSNWAIGILFDSGRGRGFRPEKPEQGIMFLFPLIVIRVFWQGK